MRDVRIKCDRCHQIIQADPYKIRVRITDRETGSVPEDSVQPTWVLRLDSMDLCEDCARDVMLFAARQPKAPRKPKEEPKAEPAPGTSIDTGKIRALWEAGWDVRSIYEEVGCSYAAVALSLRREKDLKRPYKG